jgi:solute carrier family 45 protein 1/2/4
VQLGILLQKGAQGEALVSYIDRSKDYDDLSKYGRHTEDGAPLMQRSFSSGIDDDSIDEGGFQKEVDTSASRRSSEAPLQSGTISGLHNVIIVVPQFIMTALTSIVFSYLSSEGGGKASEAANFGFILRLGGIAALVSSFYSFRLARRYSDFLEG